MMAILVGLSCRGYRDSQEEELELTMFGLKMTSIGKRVSAAGLSIEEIRETVSIEQDSVTYMHFIRPQESDEALRLQIIQLRPCSAPDLLPW